MHISISIDLSFGSVRLRTVKDTLVDSESTDSQGYEQTTSSHEPLGSTRATGRTTLSESGTSATLSLCELHGEPLQGFTTCKD
jgi:hypothetical protein